MAKIFKVSGYIVDVNGDSNVDEVIAEVSPGFDGMINQHIHVEEADIGKWNDESPLNYDNCDLADCEKYFKRKVPVDNDRNVMAGQVYRHFKGHTVKVLHIAQDTEAPGQFCVVYECEDGAIWSRPYGMFVSEVDHVKHPNAKKRLYAFCGDKYYTMASWGNPTPKSMTISVDENGNITGLPALASGNLTIVRTP